MDSVTHRILAIAHAHIDRHSRPTSQIPVSRNFNHIHELNRAALPFEDTPDSGIYEHNFSNAILVTPEQSPVVV